MLVVLLLLLLLARRSDVLDQILTQSLISSEADMKMISRVFLFFITSNSELGENAIQLKLV